MATRLSHVYSTLSWSHTKIQQTTDIAAGGVCFQGGIGLLSLAASCKTLPLPVAPSGQLHSLSLGDPRTRKDPSPGKGRGELFLISTGSGGWPSGQASWRLLGSPPNHSGAAQLRYCRHRRLPSAPLPGTNNARKTACLGPRGMQGTMLGECVPMGVHTHMHARTHPQATNPGASAAACKLLNPMSRAICPILNEGSTQGRRAGPRG